MAHVRFAVMTTPRHHELLKKEMTQRKYYVEGPLMKGYTVPVVNEMKLYDVRMLKEGIPQFLRDLKARDFGSNSGENIHHHVPYYTFVSFFIRLFRKLTRHYVPEYLTLTPNKLVDRGWDYVFLIGCYKDPEEKPGVEEL